MTHKHVDYNHSCKFKLSCLKNFRDYIKPKITFDSEIVYHVCLTIRLKAQLRMRGTISSTKKKGSDGSVSADFRVSNGNLKWKDIYQKLKNETRVACSSIISKNPVLPQFEAPTQSTSQVA